MECQILLACKWSTLPTLPGSTTPTPPRRRSPSSNTAAAMSQKSILVPSSPHMSVSLLTYHVHMSLLSANIHALQTTFLRADPELDPNSKVNAFLMYNDKRYLGLHDNVQIWYVQLRVPCIRVYVGTWAIVTTMNVSMMPMKMNLYTTTASTYNVSFPSG